MMVFVPFTGKSGGERDKRGLGGAGLPTGLRDQGCRSWHLHWSHWSCSQRICVATSSLSCRLTLFSGQPSTLFADSTPTSEIASWPRCRRDTLPPLLHESTRIWAERGKWPPRDHWTPRRSEGSLLQVVSGTWAWASGRKPGACSWSIKQCEIHRFILFSLTFQNLLVGFTSVADLDPGSGAFFLTPGSGIGFLLNLISILWFLWLPKNFGHPTLLLLFFDPGWTKIESRILDKHSGSATLATNITKLKIILFLNWCRKIWDNYKEF